MDIEVAVFLWLAPLAMVLVLIGLVLSKLLGGLPQWLYAGALLLCLGIVVWAQVWMSEQDGGLEILGAWVAQVNAAVAAVVVAVAWGVRIIRIIRTRREHKDQEPDSANAARLR